MPRAPLPGRCLLVFFAVVALGVAGCETPPGEEPDLDITRPLSPVSSLPTETWRPGMVVWVDLVTSDLEGAVEFYSEVLGWQFVISENLDYAEASHHGRMVGSIARYNEDGAGSGDGQWLISISVPDVDAAAAEVARQGGEVLVPPEELPNRGRYTLVRDTEGAMCMFLRATGGDPEEAKPALHDWMWADLWSREPDRAAAFYGSVAGYRSRTVIDQDGTRHLVLGRGGKARAGVIKLPWKQVEPSWVPCLLVKDVPTILARVEQFGGDVVFAEGEDPDVALVADPGGGVFAIQEQEVK